MTVTAYDSNFDIPLEIIKFPGGEPHVKVKDLPSGHVYVDCRFKSNDDFITALAVTDALRRYGVASIRLFIPYFPGARQDRVKARSGESLTCKVYADIINAQGYDQVIVVDPHSDVVPALLNNCKVITQKDIFCSFKKHLLYDYDGIICPDAGARKKCEENEGWKIYYASKKRDMATGKLSGFVCEILPEEHRILFKDIGEEFNINNIPRGYYKDIYDRCYRKTAEYVLVDDICDGGGTFIGLAEEIRKQNKESPIDLFVSHGIFSNGLDELLKSYRKILTTDSIYDGSHPMVSVVNLKEILIWRR